MREFGKVEAASEPRKDAGDDDRCQQSRRDQAADDDGGQGALHFCSIARG